MIQAAKNATAEELSMAATYFAVQSLQPRVAVVVLDWNGADETLECMTSVLASRYAPLDVWLVDNASRAPAMAEVARRHPQVHTIGNARNLGYAGGNNVGIRAALDAGAAWVLVLNNDARLRPDTVDELVAVARRDPEVERPDHDEDKGDPRALCGDEPVRVCWTRGVRACDEWHGVDGRARVHERSQG